MGRITDISAPNGYPSWIQDALDAPDATSPFGQTMTGTWVITTEPEPDTTAPNT